MRGMRPSDVWRLTAAADPRISPDGATIAYVVAWVDEDAKEARSAIWSVRVDGSTGPRRLTAGEVDGNPRWSPDGRWLAFTSKRGEHPAQLFILPADGPGEARRLTDLQEAVESPTWSADGSRIAFVARDHDAADDEEKAALRAPRRITRLQYRWDDEGWTAGRERHVYVVEVDRGEVTKLTDGPFEDQWPTWSPDGSTVAFVSARHEDWDVGTVTDLYTVPAAGGDVDRLTHGEGSYALPAWSPDGRSIAALFVPGEFDEPRHGRIAAVDPESGDARVLTADLDRNALPYPAIRPPVWLGDDVLFAVEDQGRVPLYRVPADGSTPPAPFLEPDGALSGFDVVGDVTAHATGTPTRFSEVHAGDRRLTDVSEPFLAEVSPSEPEPFTAVAPDGTEVPAWILRPADFDPGKPYPAVLNIHGGPFTQFADRFFDEFQVYAGAGYAVLYANPRGSSGYSEEWGRAIRGPVEGGPGWGSVDYEDLMAVVDEAVKRFGFIDADRLGVMGGSYGGFMTSWVVGRTDRFRCAISERAVNDLASEDGTADLAGFFKGYVGAYPWEEPKAYRQISPLTYADRIDTPLLILHSEDDLRCPISQGEQLFTALRARKREVEFVRFPGESHELTRSGSPVHRVQRFEIVLEWLDRHLKG